MTTIAAPVSCAEVYDDAGRLILIPTATVAALRNAGETVAVFRIPLAQLGGQSRAAADAPASWLTLKEAAARHLTDVDGRSTLSAAKSAVHRAIRADRIRAMGAGPTLRIDPESLDVWRLTQRERGLDRAS